MDGDIRLGSRERRHLLQLYRSPADPAIRLRAHIVLLLADGRTWAEICAVLYCSSRTVALWKERFLTGGEGALQGRPRGRESAWRPFWSTMLVIWATIWTPRNFGFRRSRWSCEALMILLWERHQVKVSSETIRRRLREAGLVWRRPRPVLGLEDPRKKQKLRELRQLLAHLPDDEVAVFQDEVDINTNPKIGSMWMFKGKQAEVPTPGDNEKRYLAGSQNWRTRTLIITPGRQREGRNSELFCRHLDDLRRHLRRYRKIHVICDNARFHDPQGCRKVREYLQAWGHRIELHFLPTRSPDTNPVEKVWWRLHEQITRNHRCFSMEELLDQVIEWLEEEGPECMETGLYQRKSAA
jgi:transposase